MWIKLNKEVGFGDIGTAVLYKETKCYPDLNTEAKEDLKNKLRENINSYRGVKVLYRGSNKNIMERDFAEYDFSYILKKNKVNNKYIISDLDDNSKALIGYEFKDFYSSELNKLVNNSVALINQAMTASEVDTHLADFRTEFAKLPTSSSDLGELRKTLIQRYNDYEGERVTLTGFIDTDDRLVIMYETFEEEIDLENIKITPAKLMQAINKALPYDVKLLSVKMVNKNFNARFDAKSKTYRYSIKMGKYHPIESMFI